MNSSTSTASPPSRGARLRELAALFLKLGATAFGGPLAHIAMMEEEVVTRRRWFDRQQFLDLVGATNIIPGPNSTELTMSIGYQRAGWAGLLVAGTAFIVPAFVIVLLLAWLYVRFGALPAARALLYGTQPVIMAIVAQALVKFAFTALKNRLAIAVAVAALVLAALRVDELILIAGAAALGLATGKWSLARHRTPREPLDGETAPTPPGTNLKSSAPLLGFMGSFSLAATPSVGGIFLVFLKIGALIYGSGYVLLAFLRADLVDRLHWLSERQLLDAIAVGQVTPGPVFTTATFAGYQILGLSGAIAATVAIFAPSFFFVALLQTTLEHLKNAPLLRSFLDSVNAASLALMAFVTWQLGRDCIRDVPTALIAVLSLLLLMRTRINSTWLLGAGALIGLLLQGR